MDEVAGVVIAVRRGDTATDRRPSLSATDGGRTCRIVSAGSGSPAAWSYHDPHQTAPAARGRTGVGPRASDNATTITAETFGD